MARDGAQLVSRRTERRERILRHALERFAERGFVGVSLDELVAQLRVSKSTIYEFFGSKQGLLEAVVRELGRKLEEGLAAIVQDTQSTLGERILRIAEYQGRAANVQPVFFDQLRSHAPRMWDLYQEQRRQRIDTYYLPLIEEAIDRELFDPRLGKDFILAMYLKMSEIISHTDILERVSLTREECYERIMRVFLDGVRPRAPA